MGFAHRHLLGIEQLSQDDIVTLLDLADTYADLNRQPYKHSDALKGLTQINMFFENSTRTQASFEIAGKRLGADVMNMAMQASSIKKGETLIDTAMTLNAMHPDLLVVRHPQSGAVDLLAQKVNCAVLNAGDGRHEHPTQALLDALTIRRAKGRLHRLSIAICGDIAHSRVARSNILLLGKMENRIRLIAPPTLMPSQIGEFGVEVFDDMEKGLRDVDVVMMLRLQKERMDGGFIPSEREYYHRFGLDAQKLSHAAPDAIVMHPGPMNRGVEIDGTLADDINRSVIQDQVEMGVAVRMAAMDLLARNLADSHSDEQELLRWRISPTAFFWRSLTLMLLTMLAWAPALPYFPVTVWALASVLSALFYMWIFEEFQIWYANRKTVWRLTNRALYIDEPNSIEPLQLALTDIEAIGKLSLWSIVLRLPTHQSITLPLVPNVRKTKARIAQAIEAAQ